MKAEPGTRQNVVRSQLYKYYESFGFIPEDPNIRKKHLNNRNYSNEEVFVYYFLPYAVFMRNLYDRFINTTIRPNQGSSASASSN